MIIEKIKLKIDREVKILARNSSWIVTSNLTVAILAFIKSIVIARSLSTSLFGTYVLIVSVVSTIQEVFNLNIGTTIIKYGSEYSLEGRSDKVVALAKGGLLSAGIMGLFSFAAAWVVISLMYDTIIGVEGYQFVAKVYGLVALSVYIDQVFASLLRLYYKFKINALANIVYSLVEFAIVYIVLWVFSYGLEAFIYCMIVNKLLKSVILASMAVYELKGDLGSFTLTGLGVLRGGLRSQLAFTLSVSGTQTLNAIRSRGDKVLLGIWAGPQQVALYEIATKLSQSLLRLTDPLQITIYPQLASLAASGKTTEIRQLLKQVGILFGGPALIAALSAPIVSEEIIVTLFGASYKEATSVFNIFLWITAITLGTFWNGALLNSLGLANLRFKTNLLTLIVMISVAYHVVPLYGAAGMAAALLSANIMNSLYLVSMSWRVLNRKHHPV